MAKRKENQTDVVQAAQSRPADAESKVKTDPDPGQSQPPENEAPDNAEQQSQPPEDGAPEDSEVQQNHTSENELQKILEMLQNPEQEAAEQDDLEIMQNQKTNAENPPTFVIICRNKINKMIGGVSFVDGIGYTSDGFTASWFGNKEGYEVRNSGL